MPKMMKSIDGVVMFHHVAGAESVDLISKFVWAGVSCNFHKIVHLLGQTLITLVLN